MLEQRNDESVATAVNSCTVTTGDSILTALINLKYHIVLWRNNMCREGQKLAGDRIEMISCAEKNVLQHISYSFFSHQNKNTFFCVYTG